MESPEPLSGAAIDRILDRVREAPGGGSLDLGSIDRSALREDLHWQVVFQLMATDLGSASLRTKRAARRAEIQRTVVKLSHLLRVDAADNNGVLGFYPLTDPGPRRVILRVGLAARRAKKFPPPEPACLTREAVRYIETYNARSQVDHLVGRLEEVFAKHFHREPGYTTSENGTDGPFLRFVDEVLREYGFNNRGKPYALSTFAAALRNARKSAKRRKPRDKN
jgi:hypothetical protein